MNRKYEYTVTLTAYLILVINTKPCMERCMYNCTKTRVASNYQPWQHEKSYSLGCLAIGVSWKVTSLKDHEYFIIHNLPTLRLGILISQNKKTVIV